jgi:hypothetical protein
MKKTSEKPKTLYHDPEADPAELQALYVKDVQEALEGYINGDRAESVTIYNIYSYTLGFMGHPKAERIPEEVLFGIVRRIAQGLGAVEEVNAALAKMKACLKVVSEWYRIMRLMATKIEDDLVQFRVKVARGEVSPEKYKAVTLEMSRLSEDMEIGTLYLVNVVSDRMIKLHPEEHAAFMKMFQKEREELLGEPDKDVAAMAKKLVEGFHASLRGLDKALCSEVIDGARKAFEKKHGSEKFEAAFQVARRQLSQEARDGKFKVEDIHRTVRTLGRAIRGQQREEEADENNA